jgi:hypothetical protein
MTSFKAPFGRYTSTSISSGILSYDLCLGSCGLFFYIKVAACISQVSWVFQRVTQHSRCLLYC